MSKQVQNQKADSPQKLPKLSCLKASSFEEYQRLKAINRELYFLMQDVETAVLCDRQNDNSFELNGYCCACNSLSSFKVNHLHRQKITNGIKVPNWREGLSCASCSLNNRKRGALHVFLQECSPTLASKIYLTEQISPVYKYVAQKFPLTFGSEYLGEKIPYGTMTDRGVRNESLTSLTFEKNKFDYILSLDVLEHIPNYVLAFRECLRVLKPKGKLVLSVPFCRNSPDNIIRAKVDERGNITHLKKAQYHGDPIGKEGVLCFQDFGWQMLDEMRDVGFRRAEAIIYRSRFYGYLGGSHIIFVGQK